MTSPAPTPAFSPPRRTRIGRRRLGQGGLVILAIVLISLTLRGSLVAVAPVARDISGDLDVPIAWVGLLTSLPVLCFAVLAPFASMLIGKAGANMATTIMIIGVALGTIIRSAGGMEATIVGTVIMGAFITVGNVVIPVIIRRDVPTHRVGIVTGGFHAASNVASMITTLATAPLAALVGWQAALLGWGVFSVLAAVGWIAAVGWRGAFRWGVREPRLETGAVMSDIVDPNALKALGTRMPTAPVPTRLWTSLSAILLSVTLAGQAFSYYGITAWLPSILQDQLGSSASSAGVDASVFQVAAVIGALGVPLLAKRLPLPTTLILVAVLWVSCILGLLLSPENWWAWGVLGGIAQGGGITLVFILIVQLARTSTHARGLSAMVQGVGYAVAATAPLLLGAVHDGTDGWTVPILILLGATLVFAGAGFSVANRAARAARPALSGEVDARRR